MRRLCSAVAPAVCVRHLVSPSSLSQPSLTQYFPGSPLVEGDELSSGVTEAVKTTVMPNGARIVSHDLHGAVASVGAYILAGPVYDPVTRPGVGCLLHTALASVGSEAHSASMLQRALSQSAASLSHFQLHKHYIGLRVTTAGDAWKKPINSLSGSPSLVQSNIFNVLASPKLPSDADVANVKSSAVLEAETFWLSSPSRYAIQQLETVAFFKNRLGSPSHVPRDRVSLVTAAELQQHYNRYVVPSRVVIAGVNVVHEELVEAYENTSILHSETSEHHRAALKEVGKVYSVMAESAQYTGGERHDHVDSLETDQAFVAVGWPAAGRSSGPLRQFAACLVLRSLLLGSFRTKGLPTRSSPFQPEVGDDVSAFYHPYQSGGLLGFTCSASGPAAAVVLRDAGDTLRKCMLATREQVEVAKQHALVNLFSKLTSSEAYCDFLGTSLSPEPFSRTSTSRDDIQAAVSATTVEDVTSALGSMLSHPVSFYAHGNTAFLPSARQLGF